jgi:hypothetical protein
VPKRPRFSRWRRLPGVFRTGDNRPKDSGTELDRIILYVPARILDVAESLAEKAGVPTIQDYCGLLLMRAIENERVRQKVADIEIRRGPLEGLNEIADDPHYLAEWQQRSDEKSEPPSSGEPAGAPIFIEPQTAVQPLAVDVIYPEPEAAAIEPAVEPVLSERADPEGEPERPQVRVMPAADFFPAAVVKPMVQLMSERSADETLFRHVAADLDEWGFLPCLRRGNPVPVAKVAEIETALGQLGGQLRGTELINLRTAHALYRLALESQVLLTDAWPGVFDERVIQAIRNVQEAVERILSGQDVPGNPARSEPGSERSN